MSLIMLLVAIVAYLFYVFWQFKKAFHMLQQNSYVNSRYYKWMKENTGKVYGIGNLIPVLAIGYLYFSKNLLAALAIWAICYGLLFYFRDKSKEKKKLVITDRVKRLFGTAVAVMALIIFLIDYERAASEWAYTLGVMLVLMAISFFAHGFVLLVNSINLPIEKRINNWYYNDAKKRLASMPNLKILGITGSFGKTSTKHFVHTVLTEKFTVLMTPESYNTPMGVTKTIRTMLKPIDEIFIAEMGAKKSGDIKEICDLVSPKIGILTSIGEQHLDTFKTLETVSRTKYELIQSLPEDGLAFMNLDDENIRNLPNLVKPPRAKKVFYYGINSEGLHYWAEDIKLTAKGTVFTVCKYDGSRAEFQTKLLGAHNIYNILAATGVGSELGMDLETIGRGVRKIKPVPHRLELKKTPENITIIDDSFNSNPVGSKMALEVLGQMEGTKKILVTPGMIELGEKEYEYNKQFGKYAAEVCDHVILVGPKRTIPIQDGLKEMQYPQENIYLAKNLNEALTHMRKVVVPGSVVLLENDLPDTYNE